MTPVFGRFAMTSICLRQRAWVCRELVKYGIDATCVVIGDDENLAVARRLGFAVVKCPNDYLGRKFNEGYEFAAAEGVDYVAPIGSDTWVDPAAFEHLPKAGEVLCSHWYAVIREDGLERADCFIDPGPDRSSSVALVFQTAMMEPAGYRPNDEFIQAGCDGALIRGLSKSGPITFTIRDLHPLQNVALRSDRQITKYENLKRRAVSVTDKPFSGLRSIYPARLVREVETLYAREAVAA